MGKKNCLCRDHKSVIICAVKNVCNDQLENASVPRQLKSNSESNNKKYITLLEYCMRNKRKKSNDWLKYIIDLATLQHKGLTCHMQHTAMGKRLTPLSRCFCSRSIRCPEKKTETRVSLLLLPFIFFFIQLCWSYFQICWNNFNIHLYIYVFGLYCILSFSPLLYVCMWLWQ